MFILGLDIGYSNLKVAFGDNPNAIKTKVMPIGAGSYQLMPHKLTGEDYSDCMNVVVDGEKWVAGVEPDKLQGWERELHCDYPSTKSYRALFYAALLISEKSEIDLLVTGLPVSQFKEPDRVSSLINQLKGEHKITAKRTVTVSNVLVVPQPAGAYLDIVNSVNDSELLDVIKHGKTVVIDPGFFSVDWVLLDEGGVRYHSSGTSLKAMSVLIQEVDNLLRDDHGTGPGLNKIEKAIRSGSNKSTDKLEVFLLGQKVDIREYIDKAAIKVTHDALTSMRKSMREEGMDADVVLLTGGGARAYYESAKELFPKSRIIVSDDSVIANARGFWFCGN